MLGAILIFATFFLISAVTRYSQSSCFLERVGAYSESRVASCRASRRVARHHSSALKRN